MVQECIHADFAGCYTPLQLRFHAAHKARMRRMRAAGYCPHAAPVKALPPPITVVCNGSAESAASQEMERVLVAESAFCKNCTCERCVQMRLHVDVIVERKTVSQILLEVSKKYRVSVNGIKSAQRTKRLVQPRFEVCWRAGRNLTQPTGNWQDAWQPGSYKHFTRSAQIRKLAVDCGRVAGGIPR